MIRAPHANSQEQAEQALTELRHVVRGIHPPILTDRGLIGAVRALAAGAGVRVTVDVAGLEDDGSRAPAAVEAAAYFVVAEALTNVAKHSGSPTATVRIAHVRRGLQVEVADQGHGGAAESSGSGLLGMRRRVAALDGTLRMSSPAGGPTVVRGGPAVRAVSPQPCAATAPAVLLGDDMARGTYCVPSRHDCRQPHDDIAGRSGKAEPCPTIRNRKTPRP